MVPPAKSGSSEYVSLNDDHPSTPAAKISRHCDGSLPARGPLPRPPCVVRISTQRFDSILAGIYNLTKWKDDDDDDLYSNKRARVLLPASSSRHTPPRKTRTVMLLSKAFRVFKVDLVCALRSLFWRSSDERKKSRGDRACRIESNRREESLRTR